MKATSAQCAIWLANGHGIYNRDLTSSGGNHQHSGNVAKLFFNASAKLERMVVHFHRPTTRSCDAFHRALSYLVPCHPETRFVGINVEGCNDVHRGGSGSGSKFLVERLGIVVMLMLLIIRD